MTAAKRGPRGSTAGPADMSPPWRGARERASEWVFPAGGEAGTAEADPLGQTQAAAHAAEVDRATLRQQSEGQPAHERQATRTSLKVGVASTQ
ncbi:hypothetical protein GCM10022380_21380 [Amycolatopsis tucumanensis]|uniref:Uncharacterized protein n=1 Tax=Amycolatopsis tucumanensis TaxID=401106 RepID=A0ABP7HV97_9PSEU